MLAQIEAYVNSLLEFLFNDLTTYSIQLSETRTNLILFNCHS